MWALFDLNLQLFASDSTGDLIVPLDPPYYIWETLSMVLNRAFWLKQKKLMATILTSSLTCDFPSGLKMGGGGMKDSKWSLITEYCE